MNRIYRLIWSTIHNTWVVVAENVKAKGKRSGAVLLPVAVALSCTALAATPDPVQLPVGGTVVAGQAAITQSGARMDIVQTTQRGVVNWNSFNVGAQAEVNFKQPDAGSVTLNRVCSTAIPARFSGISAPMGRYS